MIENDWCLRYGSCHVLIRFLEVTPKPWRDSLETREVHLKENLKLKSNTIIGLTQQLSLQPMLSLRTLTSTTSKYAHLIVEITLKVLFLWFLLISQKNFSESNVWVCISTSNLYALKWRTKHIVTTSTIEIILIFNFAAIWKTLPELVPPFCWWGPRFPHAHTRTWNHNCYFVKMKFNFLFPFV